MSHIVFFSYARKDLDTYLLDFFKDLCKEMAPRTDYEPEDEELSFRDKVNVETMENWRLNIANGLQSSTVMVCVTSKKYFNSSFCGKEFSIFNTRRRQGLKQGQAAPPVMLPLIWVPSGSLPEAMDEVQQVPKEIPDSYLDRGLRDIARFDRAPGGLYDKCITAFANAIIDAWEDQQNKIKPLAKMPEFENIPNAFAGGKWEEAVGPDGAWLEGPEVANFVFVAQSKDDGPGPEGRYGSDAAEWRPYFPTEPETVLDHAAKALKKQFKFREIRVNNNLPDELEEARKRKNLSIMIGDPRALPLETFKAARSLEQFWWDGYSLLVPCHEAVAKCEEQEAAFKAAFPVISQIPSSNVRRPRNPAELQSALDTALFDMRKAVTQPQIDGRNKTEPPPPGISGSGAPRN